MKKEVSFEEFLSLFFFKKEIQRIGNELNVLNSRLISAESHPEKYSVDYIDALEDYKSDWLKLLSSYKAAILEAERGYY